ncbi:MAG: hypothetical protein Q9226_001269 [Calogaya cf. arnoldii]
MPKRKRAADDSYNFEEDISSSTKRQCTSGHDWITRKSAIGHEQYMLSHLPANNPCESEEHALPTTKRHCTSEPDFVPRGPAVLFEQSILSRLPAELRLHIYKLVLQTKYSVHFQRQASTTSKRLEKPLRPSAASEQLEGRIFQKFDSDKDLIPTQVNRTALLRTCRQVYLDAVNLLYQSMTFVFDEQIGFTAFEQVAGHQNFNHIRHLQLEFKKQFQDEPNRLYEIYNSTTWEKLWSAIAGMSHLQTLKVDLDLFVRPSMIRPAFKDHCRPILEPLLALRGLKEFDLKLAYWAQWLWRSPRPGRSGGPIIDLQLPNETLALIGEVKEAATKP